jgi:hypothetical protein
MAPQKDPHVIAFTATVMHNEMGPECESHGYMSGLCTDRLDSQRKLDGGMVVGSLLAKRSPPGGMGQLQIPSEVTSDSQPVEAQSLLSDEMTDPQPQPVQAMEETINSQTQPVETTSSQFLPPGTSPQPEMNPHLFPAYYYERGKTSSPEEILQVEVIQKTGSGPAELATWAKSTVQRC